MNLSKKVKDMIDNVNEDIEPIDTPPLKSNDEKLVLLLECVGLAEGFNFCYDEGEILIPDDVDINPNKSIKKGKNLKMTNWPGVSFDTTGVDIVAKFMDEESIEQSVILPLSVYQLMLHYS